MNQKRNYGIDLLRIVSIFMICILHTQAQGGILMQCDAGSIKYACFYFLHTIAYCAVDCFALISGYTSSNKPNKYSKIINMWFQVVFYSFLLTLLLSFTGLTSFNVKLILKNLLPITHKSYWYFTAYFGLFFIKPFLDNYIFKISKETSKKYFITIFILFTVINFITEPFVTNNGYSLIWLIALYCLGALTKRIELFKNKHSLFLIATFFASTAISWGVCMVTDKKVLINYISPTITLNALILTILFSRINTNNKLIKVISPLTFGVYLFQLNPIIWNYVLSNRFSFIESKNIILGITLVFMFATLIFTTGAIIEFIRCKLFKILRIDRLSEKIEVTLKKMLDYSDVLLR